MSDFSDIPNQTDQIPAISIIGRIKGILLNLFLLGLVPFSIGYLFNLIFKIDRLDPFIAGGVSAGLFVIALAIFFIEFSLKGKEDTKSWRLIPITIFFISGVNAFSFIQETPVFSIVTSLIVGIIIPFYGYIILYRYLKKNIDQTIPVLLFFVIGLTGIWILFSMLGLFRAGLSTPWEELSFLRKTFFVFRKAYYFLIFLIGIYIASIKSRKYLTNLFYLLIPFAFYVIGLLVLGYEVDPSSESTYRILREIHKTTIITFGILMIAHLKSKRVDIVYETVSENKDLNIDLALKQEIDLERKKILMSTFTFLLVFCVSYIVWTFYRLQLKWDSILFELPEMNNYLVFSILLILLLLTVSYKFFINDPVTRLYERLNPIFGFIGKSFVSIFHKIDKDYFVEEQKDLIRQDEIRKVIANLQRFVKKKSENYNELIITESRFVDLKKEYRQGKISEEDFQIRKTKIKFSLAEFLDSVADKKPMPQMNGGRRMSDEPFSPA